MRPVVALIGRAASLRAGVLIRGEGGTGRRVIAEIIHAMDARSGPFVSVDCAAHEGASLEGLLFGAENGGHGDLETVAASSRLAAASGGTLHLANITEAPARVQHRLARVFRDREAARPDGVVVPVDVRPMASADPEFDAAVGDGRVRADLYQRLATIDINVPPLRKRREDIPALARHFVDQICAAQGVARRALSRSAVALVAALPWHGNATELRNLLEAVLATHVEASEISVEDLLGHVRLDGGASAPAAGGTLRDARTRFEREYISAVLAQHQGRISEAARALGIQRTNLYRKMRTLRVKRDTAVRR
jgi:DNA-binding NtrC family response regulator